MTADIIVALILAIGTGIIDISIGAALAFLLVKTNCRNNVVHIVVGWGVFVILFISIIGAACFFDLLSN